MGKFSNEETTSNESSLSYSSNDSSDVALKNSNSTVHNHMNDNSKTSAADDSKKEINSNKAGENNQKGQNTANFVNVSNSPSEEAIRMSTSEEEPEIQFGTPQMILAHKDEDGVRKYLIKFHKKSYYEAEWLSQSDLVGILPNFALIRNYEKHHLTPSTPPFFKESYLIPEKILTSEDFDGDVKYLTKWSDLDYDEATWELESRFDGKYNHVLEIFLKNDRLPHQKDLEIPPHPDMEQWRMIKEEEFPKSRLGYQVRSYQIEGVNFLMNSWFKRKNAILADEMGLGKTLQSLMFLEMLVKQQKVWGPFLIVAPLSTIPNWEREANEWTTMKHLSYYGSRPRRNLMSQYELFFKGTTIPKFQLLFTTYDYALKDCEKFTKIDWEVIVIDEAHRLKNNESKIFASLMKLQPKFKVLLTGTPLQNNTTELWSLLHYLDPERFSSLDEFNENFGTLSETKQIKDLQNILKPLMLRRLKGDVEKSIAPFEEIIIECSMTQHQKGYYNSIYCKNLEYLTRGAHTNNQVNLRNICMELRKCCNHPYLLNGAENQILIERREALQNESPNVLTEDFELDSLIKSSGKMILLDKLLAKLKNDGHRVLIFSQMIRMLDIIQDYLTYKGYLYQRLDGKIRGDERQHAIDAFNEPNSFDFVFLLCTKAGGVGINLTSADTVIIYDSDWNPQNDIQATARCHRIGQTKEVKVYRFITANSYERTLFDSASHKLGLDTAVLKSNTISKKQTENIEKMLKLGAYYAFKEDANDEKISEEDIDSILNRSQKIKHNHIASGTEGSTFAKLQFEAESDKNIDLTAKDFWQKYVPKQETSDRILVPRFSFNRKKIRRSFKESSDDDLETDDSMWSIQKINRLIDIILNFGYGRWDLIREKLQIDISKIELRSIARVILKGFLKNSDGDYSFIKDAYVKSGGKINHDYEASFMKHHSKEIESVTKAGANWKLSRIEYIYFLNATINSCPNPPSGLSIPDVASPKPGKWWTQEDDKVLLFHIWQNGFLNFNNIVFSQNIPVSSTQLTSRVKAILSVIKELFTRYRAMVGKDIQFNSKTLNEAMHAWTFKEQRSILRAICSIGSQDMNALYKMTKITRQPFDKFRNFVNQLINLCHNIYEGRSANYEGIPEKITSALAEKVVTRIGVLKLLSKMNNYDKFNCNEIAIIKYVQQNGFVDLSNCKEVKDTFGNEQIDTNVIKFLQAILGYKNKPTNVPQTSQIVPKIKDGKYKLPLSLKSNLVLVSLGTVIKDRPGFHNDRYVYTSGFISEHIFASVKNPLQKAWYRSLILDRGGDYPIFRVELKDDPKIFFEGSAPSKPWMSLIRAIDDVKRKFNLPSNRGTAVSGPEYFGLSNPTVHSLIRSLPGAIQVLKSPFKSIKTNTLANNVLKKNCSSFDIRKIKTLDNSTENKSIKTSDTSNNYEDDDLSEQSSPSPEQQKVEKITYLCLTFDKLNEDKKAKARYDEIANSSFNISLNEVNNTLRSQYKIPKGANPIEYVLGINSHL